MTQTLFYSFLAGLSEMFGFVPIFVWQFLTNFSGQESSVMNLAVYGGVLNGVLLFLVKQQAALKKLIPYFFFGCLAAILYFLLRAELSLISLRTGAFILIAFTSVLYMGSNSETLVKENKTFWFFCALVLIVPYIPIFIFVLTLAGFSFGLSRQCLHKWIVLQVPVLAVELIVGLINFEGDVGTLGGSMVSMVYLCACAGAFLGLLGLLKIVLLEKGPWLKNIFTFIACFALYFTSRHGDVSRLEEASAIQFSSMGTSCEVTVWTSSKSDAEEALQEAKLLFDKIENTLSTYKKESEISRLNNNAHMTPHACSDILWQNLVFADAAWKVSNGAFDVTVGPLVKLWGVKRNRSELPDKNEINEALLNVGFDKLIIDHENKTVHFPKKGYKIDFGALTKGWAVDQVKALLYSKGISKGLINLGGNIYCLREAPPSKESYKVGIKNPLEPEKLHVKIDLLGQGVATSGNYEQFIMIDGKRYTHIIDPRTGWPVDMADGVTVISNSATWCDILSTAIFIEGPPLVEKLIKENPGLNVWFVKKRSSGDVLSESYGPIWPEIPQLPLN